MNSSLSESLGVLTSDQRGDAVEMSALDAEAAGLEPGDLVSVRSRVGSVDARVIVGDELRPGVMVMEHGWG
jgi:formate dehydrogenase